MRCVAFTCLATVVVMATLSSARLTIANAHDSSAVNEALPSGFTGAWMARNGTTAPVGPLSGEGLLFTVTPIPRANGTRWLMRHNFKDMYEVHDSKQQFWVTSQGAGVSQTSTNTYCGLLNDFFAYQQPAPIEVTLTQVNRTETMMEWVISNWPVSGRWKLELLDGGKQLRSHVTIPDGTADHFIATYTKISNNPYEYLDKETVEMLEGPAPWNFTSPCNWTAPPAAAARAKSVTTKKHRGGCPFGFGKQKTSDNEATTVMPTTAAPQPSSTGYQYCYKVNEDMALTVAWTWNTTSQTVNVSVKARAAPDVDVATQYVAIGFNPDWPLMQGMDIVMGYFAQSAMVFGGCVRSMYAAADVGTPIDNPSQLITPYGVAVDRATNTIEMRFERPWVTGHRNLANPWGETNAGIPLIAFAMGNAADNCTSRPHYHYGRRGVYGFYWSQPSLALVDRLKCDASSSP